MKKAINGRKLARDVDLLTNALAGARFIAEAIEMDDGLRTKGPPIIAALLTLALGRLADVSQRLEGEV